MPLTGSQLQSFGSINAIVARDKLKENEVAFASNIDFSYEDNAAGVRQGVVQIGSIDYVAEIDKIFRYYNKTSYGDAPWYIAEGGRIHRVTGGFGTPSSSQIASGGTTDANDLVAFSAYKENVFMVSGTVNIKDNGTSTQPWIKPRPTTALSATMTTLTPLVVVSTWTVQEAVTAQVGNTFVGTGTLDVEPSTFRGEYLQAPVTTNLNSNSGNTIGNNGVHHIDLKFDEPKFVTRVSVDYSVGDTTFDNYYHTEFDVEDVQSGLADTDTLLEESIEVETDLNAALEAIAEAKSVAARRLRPAKRRVSTAKNTFNTISIPVTDLEFIGKGVGSGLADIRMIRVVIETWGPCNVQIRNLVIAGAEKYSLHDPHIGYSYWETWAITNSDNIVIAESAPSPVSTQYKVVAGQGIVTSVNASPGSWATHRILYRKGGRLLDAYAVATNTVTAGTYTDTLSDIKALLANRRLKTFIRSSMPTGVRAISEPYRDRVFVAYANKLIWTLPGNPDTFPNESEVTVSYENDRIQALHVWGDILVIVCRDSIYEMRGSVFEGDFQDWVLRKQGTQGGCAAARAAIKTPYGILLVREDGLYMYIPGQGVEQPINWAMDLCRDIFLGNGTFDPAQQKARIGEGLNQAAISHCAAAFHNDSIYLGYPSGAATRPNLVLKFDMRRQRMSLYSYPFTIREMFADRDSNALLYGDTNGVFIRTGQGHEDLGAGVVWNIGTREWTSDTETGYENLAIEYKGGTAGVYAVVDQTSTLTLGNISSTSRDWHNPTFNGTFGNSMSLYMVGTQSGTTHTTLWNMKWDALAHPYRRKFWRTDHFDNNYPGDKQWHVFFSDIEVIGTGAVTGVVYIDNTAVMTQTISGPTNGRVIAQKSFPIDTYGEIAYCLYTSTLDFKVWDTRYAVENEPPIVTEFKTPVQSLEEHLMEAADFDVNPMGTLTSVVYVDNSPIGTFTTTGTKRQSYTHNFNLNIYGRTVYTNHYGMFKHYKTWYHMRKEPDRWLNYQWGPEVYPEDRLPKTWVADIDPLGSNVVGSLYLDGALTVTETFSGSGRQSFRTGLELDGTLGIRDAAKIEVDYTGTSTFKHYNSQMETIPKPYLKKSWVLDYRKIGGATELDMAETYALDIEPSGTATITCIWEVDNVVFDTQTLTFTAREWRDKIVPPPGMRGRLFQSKLVSSQNFRVWSSSLDLFRTGRKGVSIVSVQGTPN